MKLNGAQVIVKALELEDVRVIFGYPGAAISPFYDALTESSIRHILTRHEQGAAHAANGYARVTGKPGVCIATSGPGATNLITGIANAYMDSIPIIAITGQVASSAVGTDAFQEADITGATAPFCKHNYLVKKIEDLPRILKEAFHIAVTGRPGPVVVDVPVDVQKEEIDFHYPERVNLRGYRSSRLDVSNQVKKVVSAVKSSNSPLICAGGGIISADASELLQDVTESFGIPVVSTLMGIGAMASDDSLYFGMLGTHGSQTANYALNNADLVIILGARVGDRAISAARSLEKRAAIVHVDIDPAEIGKNIKATIPVVGDVKQVLKGMLEVPGTEINKDSRRDWIDTLSMKKTKNKRGHDNLKDTGYVNPKFLLSILSEHLPEDAVFTTEVGQNQIWAANNCNIRKARTFISSGGLGTMGYGLPSAVGAKIGRPDVPVVVVSGDGSFQMSIQELGTIKQYQLGIKIILLNNACLGMVRELQLNRHGGRYSQICLESNPDFVALSAAYGIKGERISENSQIRAALTRMMAEDSPYLLECAVDPAEKTL